MRTILEIYAAYQIPPWLQLHQLRVAAVGKMVSERMAGVDAKSVIAACLLHDMGNILKFDLRPEAALAAMVPDGERDYWLSVQKQFRDKYGTNEHHATDAIVQEIGVSEYVRALINGMGFGKSADVVRGRNIELFAVEYADQRVGPQGVLSLEERIADGNRRYAGRYGQTTPTEVDRYLENIEALKDIERELMRLAGMSASEITDQSILPALEELRSFRI